MGATGGVRPPLLARQRAGARSGGDRWSPTISRTSSTKSGSEDSFNVLQRYVRRPNAPQMRRISHVGQPARAPFGSTTSVWRRPASARLPRRATRPRKLVAVPGLEEGDVAPRDTSPPRDAGLAGSALFLGQADVLSMEFPTVAKARLQGRSSRLSSNLPGQHVDAIGSLSFFLIVNVSDSRSRIGSSPLIFTVIEWGVCPLQVSSTAMIVSVTICS